ncbi:unnamed protein product [Calypogeia fissa]
MGSLKPSVRVRGAASGPILANGMPGSYNGEELRVFESDQFDPNNYVQIKCHSMSEKGMRQLCAELQDLKKASAEEMRRSVYANYTAFIRTSRELSDLEGELLAMRNLLSSQATLIQGLAEGTSLAAHVDTIPGSVDEESNYLPSDGDHVSDLELRAQALPDYLDVLLAERKVKEALITLDEGEKLAMEGQREEGDEPFVGPLLAVLLEQRARLAEQLAEAASQPSVRGAELRFAIAALDKLGEGPRAHTLLLKSHHERLKNNIRTLRPSGTSYGGAYTAALSQLVFSAIAQAVWDSLAVFGEEPSYASESVLWARREVENFAKLVKRHVLSSSAATGGLRAAAECVEIALGHCLLLEEQGLALSPALMKLLRPSVEQALDANLKRIEESVAALAAADDWGLIAPPASQGRGVGVRTSIGASASSFAITMKLTSSAHYFNIMVQDFLEDVSPLINMQLAGRTLDALSAIFEGYIGLLMKALPDLQGDEEGTTKPLSNSIVQTADALAQQLALVGNAAALADELLPRAASKLVPSTATKDVRGRRLSDRQAANAAARMPELKDWRRRLQREVDRLRDHFCQYHTLDLIYNPDDVDAQLSNETYLNLDLDGLDDAAWQQDPMPSRTMQALFAKLTNIAQTAGDLLVGRERVVTVLLMRLTETVVIWLSNDEDFWEALEDGGETGLGPNGLRQFVLDMQFIMQVASHGRYSSRTMRQVVSDTTSRAVNAYAATGSDPDAVLPDDEWLSSVAREAQRRLLTGWARGANTNGELGSPTHSVSAQSVSSVRSE